MSPTKSAPALTIGGRASLVVILARRPVHLRDAFDQQRVVPDRSECAGRSLIFRPGFPLAGPVPHPPPLSVPLSLPKVGNARLVFGTASFAAMRKMPRLSAATSGKKIEKRSSCASSGLKSAGRRPT
jgi:hypothetical protein